MQAPVVHPVPLAHHPNRLNPHWRKRDSVLEFDSAYFYRGKQERRLWELLAMRLRPSSTSSATSGGRRLPNTQRRVFEHQFARHRIHRNHLLRDRHLRISGRGEWSGSWLPFVQAGIARVQFWSAVPADRS